MSKVLKISEAASLALHTLGLLAYKPDRVFSTREVSEALGVSEAHLSKVLQRLSRAGYTSSVRGPHGGFRIAKPAEKTTLLEVYELIEGPLAPSDCLLATQVCKGDKCIFGNLLETVNRQVREYLSGTKLSDIADVYEGAL